MASKPSQLWRGIQLHQLSVRTRSYASLSAIKLSVPAENGHPPQQQPMSHHPTQPPSHRRPDFRKSQLLRQYVSTLRSTEMMLIFQHNSVLAHEYTAIRRALKIAMQQIDEAQQTALADYIKLTVVRAGMLDMALRVIKFWDPLMAKEESRNNMEFTHALSETAYLASSDRKRKHGFEKLLSGPIVILTVPIASPEHLKAALSILSPSPEFPAPKKRANAAYYDPAVQTGIPKLMLLGARIESKAFDVTKVAWVGSIQGGLQGLRGQLVQMLQGVGAGVTSVLESAGRSLHFTLEGRKSMLEEEKKDI